MVYGNKEQIYNLNRNLIMTGNKKQNLIIAFSQHEVEDFIWSSLRFSIAATFT